MGVPSPAAPLGRGYKAMEGTKLALVRRPSRGLTGREEGVTPGV